jgi:hypothetical protein
LNKLTITEFAVGQAIEDALCPAIQTANNNAAAAKEIEAAYKVQIAALEILADLATADDIEIPDALSKPFLKRFGGGR